MRVRGGGWGWSGFWSRACSSLGSPGGESDQFTRKVKLNHPDISLMGFANQILIQFLACARRTIHADLPTSPVKVMGVSYTHTQAQIHNVRRLHKDTGRSPSEGETETGQTSEGNLMFTPCAHLPYAAI